MLDPSAQMSRTLYAASEFLAGRTLRLRRTKSGEGDPKAVRLPLTPTA